MYTQCPDCATVFRVTAEVLRAAQGEVRCGVCARSFSALENLSERPFKAAPATADAPLPDDSMTVEELPASEDIELSSANEVQALPESTTEAVTPQAARGPPAGAADVALEFHGDDRELDRLFVVEQGSTAELDSAAGATRSIAGDPAADDGAREVANDLDRTDEYPIIVLDERDEPEEAATDSAEEVVLESPPALASAAESWTGAYAAPRIPIPEEMRQRLAQEAAARPARPPDFGLDEPSPSGRRWPWIAAAAGLFLLFAAQVVHSERQALVQRPGIGALLVQTYGFLGLPLTSPTDLAAYELRQWGAASDPGQSGRLLLRASIVNRAPFSQPFPLLRLALQDRFGATLGMRDIEPADYLPGESRSKLLGPGERADAEIRIVDPGQEAVGFEMDVCLAMGGGVRCANQAAAASQ